MIREIGGMAPSKGLAWALSRLPYAYRPPTQETNKIEPIGKPLKSLVPRKGLEPPTHALRMRCSTS
jgi:hypothetical protein